MTASRGLALFLATALVGLPDGISAGAPADVRLTSIRSRVQATGAALVIEATAPVAYATLRPDPFTVLIDLRNVGMDALTPSVNPADSNPIAGVTVESLTVLDAPVSRVRVSLTEPVAHRVRSDKNTVVVEFDKPSGTTRTALNPAKVPDALAALATLTPPEPKPIDILARSIQAPPAAAAAQQAGAAAAQQAGGAGAAAAQQAGGAQATQQAGVAAPAAQLPAPSAQPAATVDTSSRPGTKVYSGHPISLDFQGADLRAVLRTFQEIAALNIVIDPAVKGTVDVALRDVPWDQALDTILRTNGLDYLLDGTIVRIAPVAVLEQEDKARKNRAEAQTDAGELRFITKTLSYAQGTQVRALLEDSVLSKRGKVQVDVRTNTLIITDLSDRLTAAVELLEKLDTPQPQVEIEARIIQTNRDYARQLGIEWGLNGRADPALGNTTNLAFPNSGTLTGRSNLGSSAPTGVVGLALGSVNGALNLDATLSAAESSGKLRLLSTPRVSTQNNVPAEITQGTQIPIQVVSNNTVVVSFQDAALSLKVTPQITSANTVIMRIEVENSEPDFGRSVNGIPPIDTQRANTTVLVNDGQTTVIGGIYLSRESSLADRTPGLSRVPLLSWLFRRDEITERSTELLIFITPRITRS